MAAPFDKARSDAPPKIRRVDFSPGPHVSLGVSRSPEIPNPSREQDAAVLSLLAVEYPDRVRDFDTSTCDCGRAAKISSCASICSAQLAVPALAFHLPLREFDFLFVQSRGF